MKKLNIIFLILMSLFSVAALGAATITYDFGETKDVSVLAYNCMNSDCSQKDDFYGLITDSDSHVNNGKIEIKFPHTLWENGYALFFTSPGKLPLEIRSYIHGTGVAEKKCSENDLYCFKQANNCKAEISNFQILNVDKPYIPVVFNVNSGLDGDVSSAFHNTNTDPRYNIVYVPESLKNVYYSADTEVNLEITDAVSNQTMLENTKYYTAANNNPIYMDDSINPKWTWVPQNSGLYLAKVTTSVTDNQCKNSINQEASENFEVLSEEPSGMCYTLVNGARILENNVLANKEFTIELNYFSNYADDNGTLEPVQMDVEYKIMKQIAADVEGSQTEVASGTITLPFNNNNQSETTANFKLIAPEAGSYTLVLTGVPIGSKCQGLNISTTTQYLNLNVETTQNYDLTFNIQKSTANGLVNIKDAEITIEDEYDVQTKKATDENGVAVFSNLDEGTFTYEIKKSGFQTRNGEVVVTADQTLNIIMNTGNNAPNVFLPENKQFEIGTLIMDLNEYVSDDNDEPESLQWTVSQPATNSLTINIKNDNTVSITATQTGTESADFKVTDSQGASKSATVNFIVVDNTDNEAPEWSVLPDIKFNEGQRKPRTLNLPAYASDDMTPSNELIYTIQDIDFSNSYVNTNLNQTQLENLAGILIDDNYVSVLPHEDFFGNVVVTLRADDGSLHQDITLNVIVENVNDAPILANRITLIDMDVDTPKDVDISNVFYDADIYIDAGIDSLAFKTTPIEDVTIVEANQVLTITPDALVHGFRSFDLTAEDLKGAKYKLENVTISIGADNDAPWIGAGMPDVINMLEDGDNYELDLTAYEFDFEDGTPPEYRGSNTVLDWTVEDGYNESLISVSITAEDFMTITLVAADVFGTTDVNLTLTDSNNLSVNHILTVDVANVNDEPVVEAIENQTAQINEEFTYQVNATDIDLDNLTYTAEINDTVAWFTPASIDSLTGLINFTPSDLGDYEITVTVDDGNAGIVNTTFNLSVVDTQVPLFSNYLPANDTNYTFGTSLFDFFVDVVDNGNVANVSFAYGDSETNMNNTAAASFVAGDQYTYQIAAALDAGTYYYQWTAEDDASPANAADSEIRTFNVQKINPTMDLTLDGNANNITVSQGDTVTILGTLTTPATGDLKIHVEGEASPIQEETNASSITDTYQFNDEGEYDVIFEYVESTNYANFNITLTVTVPDTTAPEFSTFTPANDTQFEYSAIPDYGFTVDITDLTGIASVDFEYWDVLTPATVITVPAVLGTGDTWTYNITTTPLAIANYECRWVATDSAPAANVGTSDTRSFEVIKADADMILTLNGIDDNIVIAELSNLVDIVGDLNVPVSGDLRLYVDTVQIGSTVIGGSTISEIDYAFPYQAIPYVVDFEFTDTTGNYNNLNVSHTVTVIQDTEAPQFSNEVNPVDGDYDSSAVYTWTVTITDNVEVNDASVNLVVNTVNYLATPLGNDVYEVSSTIYPALAGLDAGVYNYNWEAEDTSANPATTTPGILTISKADASMVLTLNGYDADISVADTDNLVDVVGTLTVPASGDLKLYVDTVEIASNPASASVSVIDHPFAVGGPYVVDFEFEDTTGNYNNFNASHTVTVTTLPVQSNYDPASNSDLEYTSFDLTFDTDVATTCRWSLADEAYADMANDFAGAGTTSHSGTISGLIASMPLPNAKNVHVACVGEMINSNDDLVYNLIKVLDGTTLTGTNTITLSIVTDSTVTEVSTINISKIATSNIENSTIQDCEFSNCTVLNSYAEGLRNVNGCNIINSPNSVINVTGNNWTVSENSTVTNSVLNDTIVTDNSVVDNSTISNSTIEDVELTDAVVDNNIVTEGTVSYDSDGDGIRETTEVITPPATLDLTTVVNYAPVAVIAGPAAGDTGVAVSFNCLGSSDPNGDDLTCTWDFDDSDGIGTDATGDTVSHTYTAADTYIVTLTVDDGSKNDITASQIVITVPFQGSGGGGTTSHRGGGGGSSRVKTVNVWKEGTELTFRMLDLLRFQVDNTRYPNTVNVYRTDTDKVTFLISGIRHELVKGETKEFDLNNDNIADISITGVKLQNSFATLRFYPAGTIDAGSQYVAPPMPIFNIPAETKDVIKGEVKEALEDKEDVEVTAKVASFWTKIGDSFKKLFGAAKQEVAGSSWIAMGIIAGVIVIGLGAFFGIKKIFFV